MGILEIIQHGTCIRKKVIKSRPLESVTLFIQCNTTMQNVDHKDKTMSEDCRVILATAELWRVAALLYLLRALPRGFVSNIDRLNLLERAGKLLKSFELDSSFCLWPLFIIGCELQEQVFRDTIREALDKSILKGASCIKVLLGRIWKGEFKNWIDLFTAEMIYPWFIEGPTALGLFEGGLEYKRCDDEHEDEHEQSQDRQPFMTA